jgi:hypothetical protein
VLSREVSGYSDPPFSGRPRVIVSWVIWDFLRPGWACMGEQGYSHLGTVRQRSEFVEYRIEQHEKRLGERLTTLRQLAGAAILSPAVGPGL